MVKTQVQIAMIYEMETCMLRMEHRLSRHEA
jgi:hypothetical protein